MLERERGKQGENHPVISQNLYRKQVERAVAVWEAVSPRALLRRLTVHLTFTCLHQHTHCWPAESFSFFFFSPLALSCWARQRTHAKWLAFSGKSPAIMHISSGLCKQSRQVREGEGREGGCQLEGEGGGWCYKLQRMREKRKRGPNPLSFDGSQFAS